MANNYGLVKINWDKLSHLFDETKADADRTDSMWHAAVRRARTSLARWFSERISHWTHVRLSNFT